jgi:hypothetical protein
VVGLAFEYYGQSQPPELTGSAPDGTPTTTYGPGPPPKPDAIPGGDYPPGENCVFATSDGRRVARLPPLSADSTPALAKLSPGQLTDGPWCPGGWSAARWDADLLRIRRIRITVRLEAASSRFRGPVGPLFVNGGTALSAKQWLPDRQVTFDVTPRNLTARD